MGSPALSEANREAAETWRHRGRSALASTQPPTRESLVEAVRLLSKSKSLHLLDGIEDELEAVQRQLDMANVRSAQQQADARPAHGAARGCAGAPPPRPPPATAAADGAQAPPDAGADAEVSRVLESPDHYASLLIERGASEGEMKKAYHRMSRAVHPDKCSDSRATQAFQKLQAAFATLRDTAKRALYDASLLACAGGPRAGRPAARPPAARAPNPTAEAYEAERQRRAAETRAAAEEAARLAAAEAARQSAEAMQRAQTMLDEGQAEAARVNLAIRLERLSQTELRELCGCVRVPKTGNKAALRERIAERACAEGAAGVQRTVAQLSRLVEAFSLMKHLSAGLHTKPEWHSAKGLNEIIQRVHSAAALFPHILSTALVEHQTSLARARLSGLEAQEASAASASLEAKRQAERNRRRASAGGGTPGFATPGAPTPHPSAHPPGIPHPTTIHPPRTTAPPPPAGDLSEARAPAPAQPPPHVPHTPGPQPHTPHPPPHPPRPPMAPPVPVAPAPAPATAPQPNTAGGAEPSGATHGARLPQPHAAPRRRPPCGDAAPAVGAAAAPKEKGVPAADKENGAAAGGRHLPSGGGAEGGGGCKRGFQFASAADVLAAARGCALPPASKPGGPPGHSKNSADSENSTDIPENNAEQSSQDRTPGAAGTPGSGPGSQPGQQRRRWAPPDPSKVIDLDGNLEASHAPSGPDPNIASVVEPRIPAPPGPTAGCGDASRPRPVPRPACPVTAEAAEAGCSPACPDTGADEPLAHEPPPAGDQSAPRRKRKRGALGKEVLPLKQVSINSFFRK